MAERQKKQDDIKNGHPGRSFGFGEDDAVLIGSNTPLPLDDPESLWLIYSGAVDVFAVRLEDGQAVGARRHLFRAESGEMLAGFNLKEHAAEMLFVGVGVHNTYVGRLPLARFEELLRHPDYDLETAALLDNWLGHLSSAVENGTALRQFVPLQAGKMTQLKTGQVARPVRGIVWSRCVEGAVQFLGRAEIPLITSDDYLPISEETWLVAAKESTLELTETTQLVRGEFSWGLVDNFHRMVLNCVIWAVDGENLSERTRLKRRADYDAIQVDRAFQLLGSILETPTRAAYTREFAADEPLLAACKIVGRALGISIQAPPDPVDGRDEAPRLEAILHVSGIRSREVALRGRWWKQDNGPLLAYIEADRRPVALIPISENRYELHDPAQRTFQKINASIAEQLLPFAHAFYRTLPNRSLTAVELLRFSLRRARHDLIQLVFMGMAVGLLSILVPLVTGRIFDVIVPAADRFGLMQFTLLLLVTAVVSAMFQVVRSIAVLRIEMKVDGGLQAAVWDRLLNLPTPFFRAYSAGDLSSRAMGVSTIRRAVSGTVVMAVLSSIFSVFNFLLLFYLDVRLAFIATVLVLISIAITLFSGYRQMRYQRRLADVQGSISGLVLQLITGISKLRIAGVEGRAFAQWAQRFTEQKKLAFRVGGMENGLAVFTAVYPVVTAIVIFAFVSNSDGISTGKFLAFNAAFTQFLLAALDLSTAYISVLRVLPNYERLKPILQTVPEVDETKSTPDELSGEIEVSRVSFRYKNDGPLILKDVSFHAAPGDFIALVGPSGSGKSTLLRLLLGFERPASGAVFYDGQDLGGLDIRSVRQQLGVVLQNSQLMTGDIYTNIVGVAPLTIDQAWEAAAMAGLEEDIKQMPMGMHTIVSEGGSTLSGGQRQRLLISRAIAKKPKILFFDEATSALDNRTQAIVSQSLESLDATRIVIAHRLSTIINADKILVMDNGSIVQSGTYDELIRQKGLFADLARRQLI